MTPAPLGRWGAGFALALAVLGCGSEESPPQGGDVFEFSELEDALPRLAAEEHVSARDGARLPIRRYPGGAPVDLVLIHGSSAESPYLSTFAAALADAGVANVVTPDLRGHGASPARRGDIDYVDQLEDDLVDLIGVLRSERPDAKIVVGGHSSGGGFAIRLAGSPHAQLADGYLLLAPFLRHDAPTTRPNAGGWAQPSLGRIVGITMLNGFGITALNDVVVLRFDIPPTARTGRETDAYTFRMMTGFNPRNFESDLDALCAPALLLVGSDDEAFVAEAFAPVLASHAPQTRVEVIPGVKHLGIVVSPSAIERSIAWLRELARDEAPDRCA